MIAAPAIRATNEAPFWGLWRNAALLERLVSPELLTTARYEPIFRRQLGSGQIDLVFESADQSCVIAGIRLDASRLITRERSALIWPAYIATCIGYAQLHAVELKVTPWLRSIARARSMATESIRRFSASERFDQARRAELVGAAPLARTIVHMAPFVYARRFARDAHVRIDCVNSELAYAVLADIASIVDFAQSDVQVDNEFARSWYDAPARKLAIGTPDIVVADRRGGHQAAIVLETIATHATAAPIVEIPEPAPWDLLFSFDSADAPAAASFGVYAQEPPLRECAPLAPMKAMGGSSGSVVLALSPQALAMRGGDFDEVNVLQRLLAAEGFRADVVVSTDDPLVREADLIHIFGARAESHTVVFAEFALQHAIDFVFDVAPLTTGPSTFMEKAFATLFRAARDDAELRRYVQAFESRYLDSNAHDRNVQDDAGRESQFVELSRRAVAVLSVPDDRDAMCRQAPEFMVERTRSRGILSGDEPLAASIGHLVPAQPFALVHAALAVESHCLYAAIAAELSGVPLVIAGAVYDVEYLQTLRGSAPNAIVLADADPSIVSALYRRAAIWVDAASQPRSAASLTRAIACGALPVLAAESPLARIAGSAAPTFSPWSIADCARVMLDTLALALPVRQARLAALEKRLGDRRDPALAFNSIIAAYALAATVA